MSLVKSIEQHRRGRITHRQLEQQVVELKVPSMCETLKEAVAIVQEDHRLTTIVLGQGDHTLEMYKHINTWNDNNYLEIVSAMNIVGDPNVPKEKIVVGGIYFKEGIQGNCLLRNLTIRSLRTGVLAESSFTMEGVIVEKCAGSGVITSGTECVGRCIDVEVRTCGRCGLLARAGSSIKLMGLFVDKTRVHDNCTTGESDDYGLKVMGSSATIQLVSPLTKEQASFGNGGGGDWGASYGADTDQIQNIGSIKRKRLSSSESKSSKIKKLLRSNTAAALRF